MVGCDCGLNYLLLLGKELGWAITPQSENDANEMTASDNAKHRASSSALTLESHPVSVGICSASPLNCDHVCQIRLHIRSERGAVSSLPFLASKRCRQVGAPTLSIVFQDLSDIRFAV
jgi:hypothetical protein